jgi:ribosomal protection tetracycline resistance protein
VLSIQLEIPAGTIGAVLAQLARIGAAVRNPSPGAEHATIEAELPAMRAQDLQRQLPELTGGEGVLESRFAGYQPVAGPPPRRPRTTPDPLDREAYLRQLRSRGG